VPRHHAGPVAGQRQRRRRAEPDGNWPGDQQRLGTLVNNGKRHLDYTPASNDDSSVSFSYTITDGSLTAAGSATLDLTPVNDAPVTTPVTLVAIAEDSGARVITQAELLPMPATSTTPVSPPPTWRSAAARARW